MPRRKLTWLLLASLLLVLLFGVLATATLQAFPATRLSERLADFWLNAGWAGALIFLAPLIYCIILAVVFLDYRDVRADGLASRHLGRLIQLKHRGLLLQRPRRRAGAAFGHKFPSAIGFEEPRRPDGGFSEDVLDRLVRLKRRIRSAPNK
jgi:hypothetical protein